MVCIARTEWGASPAAYLKLWVCIMVGKQRQWQKKKKSGTQKREGLMPIEWCGSGVAVVCSSRVRPHYQSGALKEFHATNVLSIDFCCHCCCAGAAVLCLWNHTFRRLPVYHLPHPHFISSLAKVGSYDILSSVRYGSVSCQTTSSKS